MILYKAPILDFAVSSKRHTLTSIMAGYGNPLGQWDVAFNTGYFDSQSAYGLLIYWGNKRQEPYPDWPCLVIDQSGHARITEDHKGVGNARHAIGIGPILVRDGKPVDVAQELQRRGYDGRLLWNGLRERDKTPRTVVGILPDRQVLVGIYNGTLQEAANAMARVGCMSAVYSDGGGSSGAVSSSGKILAGSVTRSLPAALVLVKAERVEWGKSQSDQKPDTGDPAPSSAIPTENDVDSYYVGPVISKQLSKNFNVSEFASRDTRDQVIISYKLVDILQKIRDEIGRPLIINSGYRTVAHNSSIQGAARHSQHVYGRAADVRASGVTPAQIAALAKRFGATGIGTYSTFTHIDVRPGQRVEWTG